MRETALFLDLDGTLAPIAARPQDVRPDPRRTSLLERLARAAGRPAGGGQRPHPGRHRPHPGGLRDRRWPPSTAWSGATPDGRVCTRRRRIPTWPRPRAAFRAFAAARPRPDRRGEGGLSRRPALPPGRRASAEAARACARELAAETGLTLQDGDMVEELRTPGASKGDSVRAFMAEPPFAGARPVFVGDDATDEDGFAAAAGAWAASACCVGAARADRAPRYRLAGVEAALAWLEAAAMSRLIVVSNRVNPPTGAGEETVGGLAMALAAALREYSGLWFGWSGKTTPSLHRPARHRRPSTA